MVIVIFILNLLENNRHVNILFTFLYFILSFYVIIMDIFIFIVIDVNVVVIILL